MATTTLPRPSLPPSGPLPSLPIPKTRKSSVASLSTPTTPSSSTGLPLPSRSPSGVPSRPPTAPSKIQHVATSSLPRVPQPAVGANTPRALRKTISIGSFPQPPKIPTRPGSTSSNSPISNPSTSPALETSIPKTPNTQRRSASHGGTLKRPPRTSSRANQLRSFTGSGTPSLLNGAGAPSVSLLDLPSLPASRASSAHGSYSPFDDEEDRRGRHRSMDDAKSETSKGGKDKTGNVIVSVRVRPDAPGNESSKSDLEWMVDGRRSLISYRGREGGEYIYDNVFAAHDNNSKVYDSAAKRLVRRVMEGYHGTVFAYGMTGTGKTFSMQGTASSPGVIPLAITDIFSFIRETPQREFLLRVSYLEIYNEKIHDLLTTPVAGPNGQPTQQEEIKLREDSKRGVYATPLKEEIVQSPTQLLRVIARGDNNRRVAGTQFNARSSRSHAVVQIVVESRERAGPNNRAPLPPGGVRVSTLSLIDLAGSERAAESKERRTEGAHINKSLLTLGTVISKLSFEKDKEKGGPNSDKHLPYRDSKLTRLLQPALQGNSLISILCTIQIGSAGSIATAQNHTMETLNTMKFASRAKNNIVSHAKKADEALGDPGSRALLDRYRLEILDLRKQLESQSKTTKEKEVVEVKEENEQVEKAREVQQEQRHEEQMLEMQLARTALKERIEHLNRLILSSRSLGVNANRSFSSLSMRNGELTAPRSARSSTATIDASHLNRTSSASSLRFSRASAASTNLIIAEGHEGPEPEEEDSLGENGDGTATSAVQVRALQADLADKNRYIQTLEKRLLQARRSSHSRVSMSFSPRFGTQPTSPGEEGSSEAVIREKDAEISELRARLDDKERMLSALRSAGRRREVADLSLDTGSGAHNSATLRSSQRISQRTSSGSGSNTSSGVFSNAKSSGKSTATSPVIGTRSPVPSTLSPMKRGSKDSVTRPKMDEMTKMLDEMITERVHQRSTSGTQHRVDSGVSVKPSLPRSRLSES
ncbi:kinesin-domain-containing protein [Microthyrium microscopicum]|uniref:Kinesin-like protein n=1 Tax=Microthyrium microscopicum TaxID=703497 RepID=A0A6A6U4H2_9PEZI|nr:kinesin-domain-containing protein [Microthyrium microscopicum]